MHLTASAKQHIQAGRHATVWTSENRNVGDVLSIDGQQIIITAKAATHSNCGYAWRYTVTKGA